jgi:putative copper resistance protein D
MVAVLVGARLLQFSGVLLLCGTPLFYLYALEPRGSGPAPGVREPWQGHLLLLAAGMALVGTALWVMAETASFGETWHSALDPASLWTVLWGTRFGRACLIRMALLAVSIGVALAVRLGKAACVAQLTLGIVSAATFAWTGHGATDTGVAGAAHLVGDLLHLWAAGVWVGALVALCCLLRRASSRAPGDARRIEFALGRFSRLGIGVVMTLVFSGVINSWFLIGPDRWQALFTSRYGRTLSIKLGLFGAMVALAALNRFRLAPALGRALDARAPAAPALGRLKAALCAELLLAATVLLAVAFLGTLAPPMSDD